MKGRVNTAWPVMVLALSFVASCSVNAQPNGTVLNCSNIDAPFSPSPATRTSCDALTPDALSCNTGGYSLSTTYTVKCWQTLNGSEASPYYSNDNAVTFTDEAGCVLCNNGGGVQSLSCEPSIQSQYTISVAASGSNTWQVYSVVGLPLTNGFGVSMSNWWCGSGDTQLFGSDSCSSATCNCPNHNECIDPAGSYAADTCYYQGGCDSSSELNGPCCQPAGTPIIVDLSGEGFNLTSAAAGIEFDLLANGTPVRTAWTAQGVQNGWLALDRNGNGQIDGGAELFGNHTTQPSSKDPNGFLALAVFDLPANGGNGDGVIDAADAVFPKLRIWIDENHNGISEPSELHRLDEFGIYAIELHYEESRFTDLYGNQFRYKGTIKVKGRADKTIYDVILRYQP